MFRFKYFLNGDKAGIDNLIAALSTKKWIDKAKYQNKKHVCVTRKITLQGFVTLGELRLCKNTEGVVFTPF